MSSPAAGPIGRVISFAGIDEPVRATTANITSGEVRAHHVGLSEAMVTTVPVRVAPMLVLRLAADLGGQQVATSCGRAILGHPAAAVAALASPWGGRLGEALAAGWLVAAGPMGA